MKKLFSILGAVLCAILFVTAAINAFGWYNSSKYEDTAIPYIKAVVPVISKWDQKQIEQYMVPEVLEKVDDKKFTEIIAYLSRMGALVTMGEPSYSKILTASVIKEGEQTFVTYTMDATYENGDAVVEIILLDLDGDFQVYQFDIKSLTLGE